MTENVMVAAIATGVAAAQPGGLAPFDQPSCAGLKFYMDELIAGGGIAGQYPVRLEVRDTCSDIAGTAPILTEVRDFVFGS